MPHTPGPLETMPFFADKPHDDQEIWHRPHGDQGSWHDSLCIGRTYKIGGADAEANARLWAAAPDLLLTLRILLCEFEHIARNDPHFSEQGAGSEVLPVLFGQARAAIAKATGNTEQGQPSPNPVPQIPTVQPNPMPIHVDDLTAASIAGLSLWEWRAKSEAAR